MRLGRPCIARLTTLWRLSSLRLQRQLGYATQNVCGVMDESGEVAQIDFQLHLPSQFLENGERKRTDCGMGVTAEGVKSRLSPSKMKANRREAVGAGRRDDEELENVEGQAGGATLGKRIWTSRSMSVLRIRTRRKRKVKQRH